MGLLEKITCPHDVRSLPASRLPALAAEIRAFLVAAVSRTGGHVGPNLGVVELTLALHRVFESPRDRLLFDTGHQTYVHKLLTGRAGKFTALRQSGGLSGYPCRAESEHDVIENSHASTALSYADGLARARQLRGEQGHVVAVVGDGALTGGMAWEALNNLAAGPDRPVVIVLNDNGRSYAPTVGGLATHLAALRTPQPAAGSLFEDLGLAYLGPVDGHDTAALEAALAAARDLARPVVVHCLTRKGHGYAPAEHHTEDHLHGPGAFDPHTGAAKAAPRTTWTDVFGDELEKIAAERPDVVALTAAMAHPTGLAGLAGTHPERVIDVGIAEQHAVTCAAGLALGGVHPVVAVYATFLNRAFDQVLMDVALHRLPVTFALDRAGVTGSDGPSHNGMWDLSMLYPVPGLRIAAPRDAARLRELLREAVDIDDGPSVVRYPKGEAAADLEAVARIGTMDVLSRPAGEHPRPGTADVLLVGVGSLAAACVEAGRLLAAQGLAVTVVDPRWAKPLDPALAGAARRHRLVAVVEDNGRVGAVGDAVARLLRDAAVTTPLTTLGVPQTFLAHADRNAILAAAGLSAPALARTLADTVRALDATRAGEPRLPLHA
ncbi:1-deoxy-D-xylulose-5-phosphate synthase [Streptomyces sp. NPDC048182]|uniref:1-deoxy-D-xylulose-5-phosphate synthase n=1 Tax=Streptomyces sp. NPDC048182 TaxID=3365507 RepID=UPI0037130C98